MTHVAIADLTETVLVEQGRTTSKVVYRDDAVRVVVFAFDTGQGLAEHPAPGPATVQVLSGRLTFTVDGEPEEMHPGSWLYMTPGARHAVTAHEPSLMLLTLVNGSSPSIAGIQPL